MDAHALWAQFNHLLSLNVKTKWKSPYSYLIWIQFGFKAFNDCAMFRTEHTLWPWYNEGNTISTSRLFVDLKSN